MEPWQEEDLRQLRLDQRRAALPRCYCCDRIIDSEFLDLTPFGIRAMACEECVGDNTHEISDWI